MVWYPSANRDADAFERADEFDITRNPNDHLAFGGFGEHFCLRAPTWRGWRCAPSSATCIEKLDAFALNGEVER